jgi:hypothetical protein
MEITLIAIILPICTGIIYGNLLRHPSKFNLAILLKIAFILFCLSYTYFTKSTKMLLLQLEVHHHIMMLLTFLIGMWLAVIWQIKAHKKDEHTNKYL